MAVYIFVLGWLLVSLAVYGNKIVEMDFIAWGMILGATVTHFENAMRGRIMWGLRDRIRDLERENARLREVLAAAVRELQNAPLNPVGRGVLVEAEKALDSRGGPAV